ncbi:MAG TPA: MBOAT family O-acyltransferase, partial [Planctomycetota bacterium]|nr:MBOAT family O-acyltransferase [Planctomycetota bacterium]
PGWGTRKSWLLAASYVFYAAWNPPFALLLLGSTLVDWWVGLRLGREARPRRRRAWLLLSLAVNLGALAFFKYGNFLLENTTALLAQFGVAYQPPKLDILLPVGISFYTFQTLSYSIDVYRGQLQPVRSLSDFALFVSFFPQLVAGPIVRARDFLFQLEAPPQAVRGRTGWGLCLMTFGLFQKVVLADVLLAPTAELVFGHGFPLAPLDAWAGTLAFSLQILFDFAGYSTCAIGAALCFGFSFGDNFRSPYGAIGFSDFWRRWHISLSTWLRDYLYIPLGGNRRGARRTAIHLMLVMLLGGLWHGAAWTFVVWGGLHGLYLTIERVLVRATAGARWAQGRPAAALAWAATLFGVAIAWVFFRATDVAHAGRVLASMFGAFAVDGDRIVTGRALLTVALLLASVLTAHRLLARTSLEALVVRAPRLVTPVWAAMACALLLAQGKGSAFLYFQF